MWIRKIKAYKIVCSHCGTEITISQDEYMKYRKEMEGYSGATVVCQKETEDGKNVDIEYTNMDCPACGGYIGVTVDGINSCDADTFGFCYSKEVTPIYDIPQEVKIEDYLKNALGGDETEETETDEN